MNQELNGHPMPNELVSTPNAIYVYDGDDTIEETDQNGVLLGEYAHTTNIDEPLAESRSGATTFHEADGLGSITTLTAANGTVAQTYTYDSFGDATNSSAP